MSLLSEFFVAPHGQATLYDTESVGHDDFQAEEAAHYKGIGLVELSMLWSILQQVDWDADLLKQFPCVLNRHNGERLIHELPAAMVGALADLPDERLGSIAVAWATCEALHSDTDLLPVVADLQALAQVAREEGQGLFLWNCA